MKNHILKGIFIFATIFIAHSVEANNCSFNRTLVQGSRGEDVRCLQQYLVSSGYSSYVYSYNAADGVFGPKTAQAVMAWQANNGIYPPSGYFDSQSIAKYMSFYPAPNSFYGSGSVLGATTDLNFGSQEARARQKIEDALERIEEAEDDIDDSNRNISSAEEDLEDAKDNIFEAIKEFFINRDFYEAEDFADEARENAQDAIDEAGGDRDGDRNSADEAIDDARDAIEDAEDEIEDADDRGRYVGDAEEMLDDARDLFDDAEEEFDDQNYDEAEDLADEARELAEDAIDEVN